MNICFETFGCRLNRAEALESEAHVIAEGHRIVTDHKKADAFVVRGCSVTARAQRECERLIAHLKKHYPNKRLIITGCLAGAEKTIVLPGSTPSTDAATSVPSVLPTRTARAYLKIQDGCAGTCAFCIVPKFRGASRSESFTATLDKAKRFIDAGYHELVVTGCNLALYAADGRRLPELLDALAQLDPACRIRLGSLEPWGCVDDVIDVIAAHENICRFLHLPIQSGSDRILKLMNRPYTSQDVDALVKKALARLPDVSIGCDLMVGFPGESEGDFAQTRALLTRLAFSRAHVFPYSERPGTPATKLPGCVRHQVRSDRAHILTNIAKVHRARFAHSFIGRDVTVLVESHGEQPKGWTSEYLWFEGPIRSAFSQKGVTHRKQLLHFTVKSTDGDVLHGVASDYGR